MVTREGYITPLGLDQGVAAQVSVAILTKCIPIIDRNGVQQAGPAYQCSIGGQSTSTPGIEQLCSVSLGAHVHANAPGNRGQYLSATPLYRFWIQRVAMQHPPSSWLRIHLA